MRGTGELPLGEGFLHLRAVIPHLLREHDRVGERFPFRDRRGSGGLRIGDAVAIGAVLGGEDLLAAAGVAGLLEIARGDEEGEQVGGLLRSEVPAAGCSAASWRPTSSGA